MEQFNEKSLVNSLKEQYGLIPYIQGDNAAKVMVAKSIKSNGFAPAEVLSFICNKLGLAGTLNDEEWQKVIDGAINMSGHFGDNLKKYQKTLEGKISGEEYFKMIASCSGENAILLKDEILLNKYGWLKAVKTLVKTPCATEEKEVAKVEKKSSIKTSKKGHGSIPVMLTKDGENKWWCSMKECEKELGVAHGTVSQHFSGKLKSVKGWVRYEDGAEAPKTIVTGRSRSKAVRQTGVDKEGHKVDVVWNSITEAANGTGIKHSSICKCARHDYQFAGGYKWEYVDKEAAA